MMYVGVGIYRMFSQTTVMGEKGKVVRRGKIPTRRKDLQAFFSRYGNSKAIIESNTVWEFAYEVLDELGLDVVLPNLFFTTPGLLYVLSSMRVAEDRLKWLRNSVVLIGLSFVGFQNSVLNRSDSLTGRPYFRVWYAQYFCMSTSISYSKCTPTLLFRVHPIPSTILVRNCIHPMM